MTSIVTTTEKSINNEDIAIIIPAYQPDETLYNLVKDIFKTYSINIVSSSLTVLIIDDGSSTDIAHRVFKKLSKLPNVVVLKHTKNIGKGAALKTGILFAKNNNYSLVITADADGQHSAHDIKAVGDHAEKLNKFTIGVRSFDTDVPLRSRFGNKLTSILFTLTFRKNLTDTQSGLRAFPAHLFDMLLAIPHNHYEYEFEVLITLARKNEILTIPITTIYEEGNPSSHFQPILDSGRIYFVFLRYVMIVPLIAILDIISYSLLATQLDEITAFSLVRLATVLLYFIAIRKLVFFKCTRNNIPLFLSFITLVLINVFIASRLYSLIESMFLFSPYVTYFISTVPMFFLNFIIQKNIIFRN